MSKSISREDLNVSLVSMVCTRRARMGAMARLVENGNYLEMTTEEACREKLAAQSIRRGLCEADEANLIEEEDMHVFDCKPMVDPLHLVCCKSCKKPIKASQYTTHAERCRSLHSTEETGLELDGSTRHKKPPRKGRKTLQTAHEKEGTTRSDQEIFASTSGEHTTASESNSADPNGLTSNSREAKRRTPSISGACLLDGPLSSPSNIYPEVIMTPEKRTKLLVTENLLIPEDQQTASGVTTKNRLNCQEVLIYPPAPLATKIYPSQRTLRLRSAINHLYNHASLKDQPGDPISPVLIQEIVMIPPHVPSPKNLSHVSESDVLLQKGKQKDAYTLPSVRKPDHNLAQSSELCMVKSNGYCSAMNFSSQFKDTNFSRPSLSVDTASTGMMTSRLLPTTYSYTGNSGTSLAAMQQSNGSVPVV